MEQIVHTNSLAGDALVVVAGGEGIEGGGGEGMDEGGGGGGGRGVDSRKAVLRVAMGFGLQISL